MIRGNGQWSGGQIGRPEVDPKSRVVRPGKHLNVRGPQVFIFYKRAVPKGRSIGLWGESRKGKLATLAFSFFMPIFVGGLDGNDHSWWWRVPKGAPPKRPFVGSCLASLHYINDGMCLVCDKKERAWYSIGYKTLKMVQQSIENPQKKRLLKYKSKFLTITEAPTFFFLSFRPRTMFNGGVQLKVIYAYFWVFKDLIRTYLFFQRMHVYIYTQKDHGYDACLLFHEGVFY